jgi:hypothetical protein
MLLWFPDYPKKKVSEDYFYWLQLFHFKSSSVHYSSICLPVNGSLIIHLPAGERFIIHPAAYR